MWDMSERWSEELEQWAEASLRRGDFGAASQQSPDGVLPEQDATDNSPKGGEQGEPPLVPPFVQEQYDWVCWFVKALQG